MALSKSALKRVIDSVPEGHDVGVWVVRVCRAIEAEVRKQDAELRKDGDRLDWLESQINTNGAIHLHDGHHPSGNGLGLRPGHAVRTLREAIDAAMQGDTDGLKT